MIEAGKTFSEFLGGRSALQNLATHLTTTKGAASCAQPQ